MGRGGGGMRVGKRFGGNGRGVCKRVVEGCVRGW